ncbi:Response regulator receiver domain-containing protein [Lentzea waywayandensis]|uniref:Response regulator receiver domain-containing protein n=1 Tax=Lentzea waywayandensis TaxID=84724 RepID=A0A1I6D3P9_9PSEU|nr:response regulator [Lentzea waywayandensis]SFR00065.1 Response regulator receiver domain-containing protein [Lentzea waywayandensis]
MIRVLIVDDDPRVRGAIRTFLLAHQGFKVVGEASGSELAVRLASETGPGVAIVDVLLPTEREGLSLLRIFSEQLGIPVVAMSLDNACAANAIMAGAYVFLAKDGYSDRLVDALLAAPHRCDR